MLRSSEEGNSVSQKAIAVGVVGNAEGREVGRGGRICRTRLAVDRAAEQGGVVVGDDSASLHT